VNVTRTRTTRTVTSTTVTIKVTTTPRTPRPVYADNRIRSRRDVVPVDLVPTVIHPDVLWACTSCRACEEQCPVMISYVDKITDMRRNLVLIKAVSGRATETVSGHGGQRQPVEPRAGRFARAGRRLGSRSCPSTRSFGALLGGMRGEYDDRAKRMRAPRQAHEGGGVEFAILARKRRAPATQRDARATSTSS